MLFFVWVLAVAWLGCFFGPGSRCASPWSLSRMGLRSWMRLRLTDGLTGWRRPAGSRFGLSSRPGRRSGSRLGLGLRLGSCPWRSHRPGLGLWPGFGLRPRHAGGSRWSYGPGRRLRAGLASRVPGRRGPGGCLRLWLAGCPGWSDCARLGFGSRLSRGGSGRRCCSGFGPRLVGSCLRRGCRPGLCFGP